MTRTDAHNAARETHAAREGLWRGRPLTEGATQNLQRFIMSQ